MKYVVKRPHIGDRRYSEGDTREASPSSVSHLVKNGVLAELEAEKVIVEAANPSPKRRRGK